MSEPIPDVRSIFLFGVLSVIVLIIGWKGNFFSFSEAKKPWAVPLRWFHVVSIFAIYFAVAMLIAPILGSIIRHAFFPGASPPEILAYASWLNFINSCLILFFIVLFLFRLPSPIMKGIWRRDSEIGKSYSDDFYSACFAWLISFPLVLFLSQFFDVLVSEIFHVQMMPEQLAVQFLKMTFGAPLYLLLAVLTIILFAPLIEETLFRGFLQSFIRQHLGSKQAIFITSLLFALFHYSPEQGLGNIPIVGSLFALALFLGFLYEKKGSLLAPMALHASFNAISVLNLYFLGGFPKGPL